MLFNILLILCAAALILVFLLLPAESSPEKRAPFWGRNFAHRGLHSKDKSVPENSLAAFTAAVDAGYGIELDIQLSKDGEVVVFHDDDLARVCGVQARVDSLTLAQLRELPIHSTTQHIPTLQEVLDTVAAQVPLIIELKMGPRNRELCERAWKILRQYDGDLCIESFDPRIVRWFKKHVPGLLRGQLAAPAKILGKGAQGVLVGWLLSNFLARPQFIAYQAGKKPFTVFLVEQFAMRIAWTARPTDDTNALEAANDGVIFEFYLPAPQYKNLPE